MKSLKGSLIFFLLIFSLGTSCAQTLDHVAISSGGIVTDRIDANLGEVFVFSVSNGMSLSAGALSDTGNTGLPLVVATSQAKEPEILVYPNPVGKYVNLKIIGLQSETVSFTVLDVNGKIIAQQKGNAVDKIYSIPVSQLSTGNYYIEGITPKGESIGKIKFIKL